MVLGGAAARPAHPSYATVLYAITVVILTVFHGTALVRP